MLTVRKATIEDLVAITEIYNDAILKTIATFDTEPKSLEEQKTWFANHGESYPILVVEQGSLIVGWSSLSRWSDRCAYSGTVEISLYVRDGYRGKGVGRMLIGEIINEGRRAGFHTVIARIADGNSVSVHLHESVGFKHIGVMSEVGRKFGRLLDVDLMQLIYNE
jgi:L-amino acid N-acyltransferase